MSAEHQIENCQIYEKANSQISEYLIKSNSNESQTIQQSDKYNLNVR